LTAFPPLERVNCASPAGQAGDDTVTNVAVTVGVGTEGDDASEQVAVIVDPLKLLPLNEINSPPANAEYFGLTADTAAGGALDGVTLNDGGDEALV